MRSWMIACVLGLGFASFLPVATSPAPYAALTLISLLLMKFRRFRLTAAWLLGISWSGLFAWDVASTLLPESLQGQTASLCGDIAGAPRTFTEFTRFRFRPEANSWRLLQIGRPLMQLNWYGAPTILDGQRWCLKVRLRTIRAPLNAGTLDVERWLVSRGIRARGTVQDGRMVDGEPARLERWRSRLAQSIGEAQGSEPARQLLMALTLGVRDGIDRATRQALVQTGTAHLLAISGLHVGMVAGLGFLVCQLLFRVIPARGQSGHHRLSLLLSLLLAGLYGWLSGYQLPAQRALIMLGCAALPWIAGMRVSLGWSLLLALLIILILQPLAWLEAGLWLSFGAVAALLLAFSGRRDSGRLRKVLRVQWVIFLALLPVLTAALLPVNALAPVYNLVAIPVVGLLVLPAGLAGLLIAPLSPLLLEFSLLVLNALLAALSSASRWHWPVLELSSEPARLVLAAAAVLLLLGPRAIPARIPLAILALLPLWLPVNSRVPEGALQLTVFDVGHGTAVLAQTRHYRLLYDTGAGFEDGWNSGEAILVPSLQSRGIHALETVIVSHADNDHLGGFAGLARQLPVGRLMTNVPALYRSGQSDCTAGTQWSRDGVQFEILHPRDTGRADNDGSCVLQIRVGRHAVLLAGDIERATEHRLLARTGERLHSALVLAPHHGSRTSSSPAFVRAVAPEQVIYSSSWPDRFGHPHPEVEERYRRQGASGWHTGKSGMLVYLIRPDRPLPAPSRARAQQRYWRAPDPSVETPDPVIELRRRAYWSRLLRED